MSEAKALLNNPVFMAAVSKAKDQAMTAALACTPYDDMGRYRFLEGVKVVDSVVNHIVALVEAEKASEAEKQNIAISDYYVTKANERWSSIAKDAA